MGFTLVGGPTTGPPPIPHNYPVELTDLISSLQSDSFVIGLSILVIIIVYKLSKRIRFIL